LGFRIGAKLRASSYGLYGYALLCMVTLREAIAFGQRYAALGGPVTTQLFRECGDGFAFEFPSLPALRHFGIEPAMAGFMTEMHMANTAGLHADVMGPDCVPARLEVAGVAPPHASLYSQYLGCPVHFGQPAHVMHFSAAWLDRSPRLANPLAAATLEQDCARLLAAQQRVGSAAAQVLRVLVEGPGVFPALEVVADCLHMSPRTLRRRLEAEGSSFQQLLDDARRARAIDYLQRTSMRTGDIAQALGFSNAASFRRAFRRWTLKGPQDFRRAT
jgi:AraC-like DNA-binding protein